MSLCCCVFCHFSRTATQLAVGETCRPFDKRAFVGRNLGVVKQKVSGIAVFSDEFRCATLGLFSDALGLGLGLG